VGVLEKAVHEALTGHTSSNEGDTTVRSSASTRRGRRCACLPALPVIAS